MNNINENVIHMKERLQSQGIKLKMTNNKYEQIKFEDGEAQMDTFFNEIKADMREREERTRKEISEREIRFEKQVEKLMNDSSLREERISSEFKEREERIISVLDKLETKLENQTKHVENIKTQNFWGNIALFVGMLAIVITLLLTIK